MADVHDDITEGSELGSSYRFCEKVADHLISWTTLNDVGVSAHLQ